MSFYPQSGICHVGNPHKVSNLVAVSALNLPLCEQKSTGKIKCRQPLGNITGSSETQKSKKEHSCKP
ncbi:hypothetical protein NM96_07045 [Neisseria mucosa]|nr:hypothetical protein NM96_07045 [Neisseria mucosa]